ncbi:EscU/YscU/HrcU family type III secretion system export apparatus switch protein [uncultured Erythrobacter sp.]|uniref:EscU/YscU/HrcU family type III secretion system export apparatus switch protein n=1 Tax=uncultured Erythrobacter sp. TaxID=263913 RepID=UPI002617ABD2|nr:EscU/YscU/HrcU family type III secretion system export apparatus switch protein [uncultured Erythrobacter sp.]
MSEESTGEKRFDPTPKKKRDAALKGDTLRSKEVSTAAAMATGTFMLLMIGPWLFEGMQNVARASFRFEIGQFTPGTQFAQAAGEILPPIFALGLAVIAITVGSQMLLGEGRWVPQNLKPKGSRINPLAGLKRIFGIQGVIELGKSILKLGLLGGIAAYWVSLNMDNILGLGRGTLGAQIAFAWDGLVTLIGMLVIGLLVIALIDYPLQMFQRNKRLKMSHQDLKNENKQTEGSPEMKMARRQRQRDYARGSVASAMKEAQFVVVNPMHFAVALTYDPLRAPAPIVLAKGRGETAMAMREMASEAGLPVLHYPQLARALYFTTRANQMVREELYLAIASLVAFVLSLKRGDSPVEPRVEVPEDLRFDADGKLPETS